MSLRGPPCVHGVSGTPYREVCDYSSALHEVVGPSLWIGTFFLIMAFIKKLPTAIIRLTECFAFKVFSIELDFAWYKIWHPFKVGWRTTTFGSCIN